MKKTQGMKVAAMLAMFALAAAARADYWMTYCRTPGGKEYAQVGYVKPDSDGFVAIRSGMVTLVVYKTQVWYVKLPGTPPACPTAL